MRFPTREKRPASLGNTTLALPVLWRIERASPPRRHPPEQLVRFVSWLTGKQTQAEIDGTATGRTFRRETAWCWDLEPRLPPATTVHHAVLVDGIWIAGWCLLIALSDTGQVLAWQWSGGESIAAWKALLEQVTAPGILVSDGGTGIPTALKAVWPERNINVACSISNCASPATSPAGHAPTQAEPCAHL